MNKLKMSKEVSSIILVVLGLVLVIMPGFLVGLACSILGIAIIAVGGISMYGALAVKETQVNPISVVTSALLIVAGIIVMTGAGFILAIIPFIVGALLVVHGITNVINSFSNKDAMDNKWVFGLAMGIICIILGLTLIIHAIWAGQTLLRLVGVFLIVDGLASFWVQTNTTVPSGQSRETIDVEGKFVD